MNSLLMALQFLTRLPVGKTVSWDEKNWARSVAFYPGIGLVIGFILWALYKILLYMFPPEVVAVLLVAGGIVITGGLHWDGFMDTMDGLGSGRDRGRMLEIMRDSRVGSFGVLGALILFFMKYSLFLHINSKNALALFLIMPLVARINLLLALWFFPYARPEGLGKTLAEKKNGVFLGAGLLSGVILIPLIGGWIGLGLAGAVVVAGWFINRRITRVLGGMTGDTYGALVELSEVIFLLGFQAINGHGLINKFSIFV